MSKWKAVRGAPGLYARGGGRYHIRFQEGGRKVSEAAGRDLRKSKLRLAELRLEAAQGITGAADNHYPVADLREAFLADRRRRCKRRTVRRYEKCLENILGGVRVETVARITPALVEDYVAARKDPVGNIGGGSDRTVNYEVGTLKTMLRFGVRSGRIASNPLRNFRMLPERDKAYRRAFTEAEVEALLDHDHPATHRGDTRRPCRNAAVWLTLAHTGLRKGELAALRWADVDFDKGVLKVRGHDDDDGPKSAASVRDIPLAQDVWAMLKRRAAGDPDADERVFTTATGRPIGGNLHRKLRACLKAAKLNKSGLCLHSFRYHFASVLISRGANPKVVQKLLGHASIEMTMRIYTQAMPGDEAGAVALLDGEKAADPHQSFTTKRGFLARVG